MTAAIIAEWLKLRRSMTSWAILTGGLFVPAIMFLVRFYKRDVSEAMLRSGQYWMKHEMESWESLSILIVPLLTILVTTLVIQIEHRNNTWKQLHASPLSLPAIFGAKLTILLAMLVAIFAVINAGVFAAGWIPMLSIGSGVPNPFPAGALLRWNARCFLACLPIVGIQYLLALRFRNFLVPMGAGVAAWIAGLVVINTRYAMGVPYAYPGVLYLIEIGHRPATSLPVGILPLATVAFATSLIAAFTVYVLARDRGAAQ